MFLCVAIGQILPEKGCFKLKSTNSSDSLHTRRERAKRAVRETERKEIEERLSKGATRAMVPTGKSN